MTSRHDRARAHKCAAARRSLISWRVLVAAGLGALSVAGIAQAQTAPLSLNEALSRAADADPRLRAADAGIDAARGGLRQAGSRPNPVLDVEVENFGGQDSLRGFDGSEATFQLSQPIEPGGRRGARVEVARSELSAAELDALIARLDVFEEVQRAYYDALAAEQLVDIAAERLATAEALEVSVERRVAAARDPLMAGARAQAGTAEARIAHEEAQRDVAIARAALASLIGGDQGFVLADASLDLPGGALHAHDASDEASPDLALFAARRDRARAEARLERSRGYRDPVLTLGVRRFEETGETGLVAGVSVPLGLFDGNRGAIAQADAQARRAGFDVDAARARIAREASALSRRLESARISVGAIERDVIPQSERALALARDGYNQGAFSYLDVLEAQRALTGARQALVEALRTYHHTEAALDRLTARFADASAEENSQ